MVKPIRERLDAALHSAVGPELARDYAVGLPRWEDTPGYLNIPIMLWLRNLLLAFDMQEYVGMRYNLLGNGGHWFPGMGAGTLDHWDLTKALQDSPFKEQIPAWLRELHNLLGQEPNRRLSAS